MSKPSVTDLLDYRGKTVVVTGSGYGLGQAIAMRFAEAGAHVVVHYRSHEEDALNLMGKIKSLGGSACSKKADLTDPAQVEEMFSLIKYHRGGCDVLINNVGAFPVSSFLDMTIEDWRHMYAVNVESSMLCSREAAKQMTANGAGNIINIASIAAVSPGPDHSHYNSAKAAVVSMTQSMAQELGPKGVRVNAVSPGVVHRDGIEDAWPEGVKRWNDKCPLGRLAQPDDIADACLFLAGPQARYITGHNLLLDGGMMASSIY